MGDQASTDLAYLLFVVTDVLSFLFKRLKKKSQSHFPFEPVPGVALSLSCVCVGGSCVDFCVKSELKSERGTSAAPSLELLQLCRHGIGRRSLPF